MGRSPAWSTRPLRFVSALPIFPGRLQPSIFGAGELNFCVRDGNRWTLTAINTDSCILTDRSAKIKMKFWKEDGDPCGNRTHVCGVRGRRLSRLTNGPWCAFTDSNRGPTD